MMLKATKRFQEVQAGTSNSLLFVEFARNSQAAELVDDDDPERWVQSVLFGSKARNLEGIRRPDTFSLAHATTRPPSALPVGSPA
jgi:hypothetical protein